MRSNISICLSIVGILVLIGCGGSGGGSSSSGTTSATNGTTSGTNGTTSGTTGTTTPNVYTGDYSGVYADDADAVGTFTLAVASSGAVKGTLQSQSFTGQVDTAGKGAITVGGTSEPITLGTPQKPTLGGGLGVTGNGIFFTLANTQTGSFGGASPFAGEYAGVVNNKTIGKASITALSVTSSGAFTGIEVVDDNGTATFSDISGTISSAGVLNYTIAVTGVKVEGTVSISNKEISGNIKESSGAVGTIAFNQV